MANHRDDPFFFHTWAHNKPFWDTCRDSSRLIIVFGLNENNVTVIILFKLDWINIKDIQLHLGFTKMSYAFFWSRNTARQHHLHPSEFVLWEKKELLAVSAELLVLKPHCFCMVTELVFRCQMICSITNFLQPWTL